MSNGVDPEKLKDLAEKFPEMDIEWRLQSCDEKNGRIWGKVLAYITNRAIMQRLDDVCGIHNWQNKYREWHGSSQICAISIKIDGEWIAKEDGADVTQTEATKGGLSDSMKRAGYQWGIGRYLYNLKDNWADVRDDGIYSGKTKDGKWFKWNPPSLPKWALPDGETPTVYDKTPKPDKSPSGGTQGPESAEISEADLQSVIGFGKHQNLTWKEAAENESSYLMWIMEQPAKDAAQELTKAKAELALSLYGPDKLPF